MFLPVSQSSLKHLAPSTPRLKSPIMNTTSETKVGFIQEPNGRGSISLLWSCLITWFLCLWTLFHANIPAHGESHSKIIGRQVWYLFFGAIAPEWIAAMALTQWKDANQLLSDIEKLRAKIAPQKSNPRPG